MEEKSLFICDKICVRDAYMYVYLIRFYFTIENFVMVNVRQKNEQNTQIKSNSEPMKLVNGIKTKQK